MIHGSSRAGSCSLTPVTNALSGRPHPRRLEFDPYYPEKYFPTALSPCQAAEQIVVYCNGGDCDDSESAAITLRDVGIAVNKLFVYGGGIPDWVTNGMPVESGGRNSGKLRDTKK